MDKGKSWETIINKLSDFEIQKGITSFVNPHSMLMLKDCDWLAQQVDYWYVDGISLVRLIQLLFKKKISRYSFDDTSLASIVFKNVASKKERIAIIGTEPDLIKRSVQFIEERYALSISYYRDGFIGNEDELQETINLLIDKKIEVVICGMGTPNQEEFLVKLKNAGWDGYGYTCGGYLHQIAKKQKNYYPVIFDKLNLRWFYRILNEPKLIRRYLINYPKFLSEIIVFSLIKEDKID